MATTPNILLVDDDERLRTAAGKLESGREAVLFLRRVKEVIENPALMLLEI